MTRGRKNENSYAETNRVADYPETDEVTDFRELSPREKLEETATKMATIALKYTVDGPRMERDHYPEIKSEWKAMGDLLQVYRENGITLEGRQLEAAEWLLERGVADPGLPAFAEKDPFPQGDGYPRLTAREYGYLLEPAIRSGMIDGDLRDALETARDHLGTATDRVTMSMIGADLFREKERERLTAKREGQ